MTRLDRPIVILGAARSGTTLLAETILARHPDVAYWPEPRVWRSADPYRRHDAFARAEATPAVAERIAGRFADFARDRSRPRFMEKHPSNCFRMPFVLGVLPGARIVHVLRDGRDVALSAAVEWAGRTGGALDSREKRDASLPSRVWQTVRAEAEGESLLRRETLAALPFYGGRLAAYLRRQVFHTSTQPWGPRFPGIAETRRAYSLLETCAVQWDLSVRQALSGCRELEPDRYLEVRYEDLVRNPVPVVRQVAAFLDLSGGAAAADALAAHVAVRAAPSWPARLAEADRTAVEDLIASTLLALGYPVGAPAGVPAHS